MGDLALSLALVSVLSGCAAGPPHPTERPGIEASLTLVGLWWSRDQMDGLDPDHPPPKRTEVALEIWEASDPVGSPHPETVDVIADIQNRHHSPVEGVADAYQRWRVGSIGSKESARWSAWSPFGDGHAVTLPAAASARYTLATIDLAGRLHELYRKDRWPWALEVKVLITQPGHQRPLAEATTALEIQPAD